MIAHQRLHGWLDGASVAASAACLVHCLALPIALAMLPALSLPFAESEDVHLWLLLGAVPISTFALVRGVMRASAGYLPLLLGLTGLALMTTGLLVPGEMAERLVTSSGTVFLASAHILNWRRRSRAGGHLCGQADRAA